MNKLKRETVTFEARVEVLGLRALNEIGGGLRHMIRMPKGIVAPGARYIVTLEPIEPEPDGRPLLLESIEFEFDKEHGKNFYFPAFKLPVGRYRAVCRIERIEELKPCPFCGGGAAVDCDLVMGVDIYQAQCESCGAATNGHLERQKAIADWNRRADDPRHD